MLFRCSRIWRYIGQIHDVDSCMGRCICSWYISCIEDELIWDYSRQLFGQELAAISIFKVGRLSSQSSLMHFTPTVHTLASRFSLFTPWGFLKSSIHTWIGFSSYLFNSGDFSAKFASWKSPFNSLTEFSCCMNLQIHLLNLEAAPWSPFSRIFATTIQWIKSWNLFQDCLVFKSWICPFSY